MTTQADIESSRKAETAITKPRRTIYLVRTLFGLAIVGELIGGAIALIGGLQQNTPVFMAAFPLLAPSIGYLVYSVLSIGAFPFEYSFLGSKIPAPPPAGWKSVGTTVSSVAIGNHFHATLPFLTCLAGPGGIQLYVVTYPPVFIATEQILSISPPSWGICTIEHSSSEIRGPIRVMQSVVAEMYRCMPELALGRS